MYSEMKNILQELKEIEIQEQDVEEHMQWLLKVLDVCTA